MTLIIKTQRSLHAALTEIRTHQQQQQQPLLAVFVDVTAAALTLADFGALLGALALPACSHLRCLEFSNLTSSSSHVNDNISNLVVPHIAAIAAKLRRLETLSVCQARVGPKTAEFVGAALAGHPALRKLVVEQCDLRDDGAVALVQQLFSTASRSALELVDLGHNDIGLDGCQAIKKIVTTAASSSSSSCDALYRVQLRGNHHTGMPAAVEFPERKKARVPRSERPLPELPQGENLHFMLNAVQPRCPFPTLEQLANAVREEVAAVG